MKLYVGLDVSVKETAICVVDYDDQVCSEKKVASRPEDLALALSCIGVHFERIGLEAGPLSQWLFEELAHARLPMVCIETRHAKVFLKAQVNKTDRN